MSSPVAELTRRVADRNPFDYDPAELREVQLEALRERLAERRGQIRVLDQRARDAGIESIEDFADLVPLLFAHTTYKSYPEAFVEKGRWDRMNLWLDTLATRKTEGVDLAGVRDVDDWLDRLHAAGHFVFGTSGTTGKCSFLDQTEGDRSFTHRSLVLSSRWSTGVEPARDRPVFWLGPVKGFLRFGDWYEAVSGAFGRPGACYYLSDERLRAAEVNRMGAMRRAIAEGRAAPEEIATFEREAVARQQRMDEALLRLVDRIVEHRAEPMILFGMWSQHYAIAEAARARGVRDGEFHPETAIFIGGGLKGVNLPDDYREQVRQFYGVDPSRIRSGYGMSEMSTGFPRCRADRYHCPPWIALLVLDKTGETLLDARRGPVEGRMAFFDFSIEGRWGGLISGDRIAADFSPCPCGARGPSVYEEIVRYTDLPEGDEKLTCAGTIEGYVRGALRD